MSKRRIAAAIILTVSASLALTGCSGATSQPSKTSAAAADFAPIDVTGIPYWKVGTLPAGWTQDQVPTTAIPNVSTEDAETVLKLNPPTFFNADRTCYAQVQTTFLQAHNADRGDGYLSKYSFYQQADQFQVGVQDEKTVQFTSDQGKIDAYSGIVERDPTMFGVAPTSATSTTGTWVAGRAFDLVTDNPMVAISARVAQANLTKGPTPSTPPTDSLKGVPVAGMSVACKTPEQFKSLNLDELISSFTLITK